jgi:hypothetical protein
MQLPPSPPAPPVAPPTAAPPQAPAAGSAAPTPPEAARRRAASAPPRGAAPAPAEGERERTRAELRRLVEEKSRAQAEAEPLVPDSKLDYAEPDYADEPDPRDFPNVRVTTVRWHPDAERRVAWIDLPQVGPLEIHEGDIVSGVLVVRIDPGAVELAVGSEHRRVALGP